MPSNNLSLQNGDATVKISQQVDRFPQHWLEQQRKPFIEYCFFCCGYHRMDADLHRNSKLTEKASDLVGLGAGFRSSAQSEKSLSRLTYLVAPAASFFNATLALCIVALTARAKR